MDQREMMLDALRKVAKLCAVAAMTAPKSGGQLFLKGSKSFIETVIVEDRATLGRLAEWMRAEETKHREAIWFRDADTADKLDLVLFIGLAKWYPPVYDCGACGFGTCAEFLAAAKKHHTPESENWQFSGAICQLRLSIRASSSVRRCQAGQHEQRRLPVPDASRRRGAPPGDYRGGPGRRALDECDAQEHLLRQAHARD